MTRIADQLPENAFKHIETGAGVILSTFSTDDWTVSASSILGATSGGVNFTDTPEYKDYGEDIDNCPKNTKELKKIDSREIKLSGTYVSVTAEQIASLIGSADLAENKITPRDELVSDDFADIWFVCDYGEDNAIAIHLMNALNTGGFQLQTEDREKGEFAFEYTAHYSMNATDTVPYEVYFKA